MTTFRLTFAGSGADQVYRLTGDGNLAPEPQPAAGGTMESSRDDDMAEVLVLPASEGLPFQLEVPFSDPEKIRRILPQMVGDRFARVTPEWRLSWMIGNGASAVGGKARVAGLAFPPQALRRPGPDRPSWRMVIPDFMLVSSSSSGWSTVIAPFSRGAVEFAADGRPIRFHVSGRGLPEPQEASSRPTFELLREGSAVLRGCSALLENLHGQDLSDWHLSRTQRLTKLAIGSGVAVLLGVALFWHLFLAWECSRLEERRRQLNMVLARSFERVFPGQRAVEPLLQARRLLEEREREAEKRVAEPVIPWYEFLGEGLKVVQDKARVEKIAASPGGWRIQGVIGSYRELSSLTAMLPTTILMRNGQTRETSPIKGDGRTVGGLRFVLEGPWKR